MISLFDYLQNPQKTDDKLCSLIDDLSITEEGIWTFGKKESPNFAHSIIQYPAMMVPQVQFEIIKLIKQCKPGINSLVDPYLGAANSFTAAMICGLNCAGQDINPLAILISKAKTELGWTNERLENTANNVISLAKNDQNNNIDVSFPNIDKWFKKEVAIELSKIRRAIILQNDIRIRRVLWVILAETIRQCSNDRTSTYKLHVRTGEEIENRFLSPIIVYEIIASKSINELIAFKTSLEKEKLIHNNEYKNKVEVNFEDTSNHLLKTEAFNKKKYDLLVTSPPYGDNTSTVPYGQNSYLPLQWIALRDIDSKIDPSVLRTTQEIDRRSLGGHAPANLNTLVQTLSSKAPTLSTVFKQFDLSKQPKDRYERVSSFYQDFLKSIDNIIPNLSNNAYLVWTIGNRRVGGIEIPNDQILHELLSSKGCVFIKGIDRDIQFKRMPHRNNATQTMHKEKILVFRKQTII